MVSERTLWYVTALKTLAAHYRRAPTMFEMAAYLGRTPSVCYSHLRIAEAAGLLVRQRGKFRAR